ncbi:Tn3 transposase DDE domain-containing protein [Rhizobium sp. RU33A]|nr:Tn3 transposase DDE domain-containing protein [Rhizobium sp. RU33A]
MPGPQSRAPISRFRPSAHALKLIGDFPYQIALVRSFSTFPRRAACRTQTTRPPAAMLANPERRRNATTCLNNSEAENTLARALFFNRLGELRDRTFQGQFYRASGQNLQTNSIVYWNTLYLEPAFAELNRESVVTPPDVIRHITPLGWQHISLTGDYIFAPTDGADLTQTIAAGNLHPHSISTLCSQNSDRSATFVP